MQLPLYQVDAFASEVFAGNPAAVCPLTEWLPDDVMQAIASENNLSETAFFVPKDGSFAIRWFTPAAEVPLCGHATLASAYVLFNELTPELDELRFQSKSGELVVQRDGDSIVLDFPARRAEPREASKDVTFGLCRAPREVLQAEYWLAVYDSEDIVRSLNPDMRRLKQAEKPVIVTAPGDEVDFVSRFFAPAHGIDEDPVTGSAHCTLTPYWSERLGKTKLTARQISARGGELACEDKGDRVQIAGRGVLYLVGTIEI